MLLAVGISIILYPQIENRTFNKEQQEILAAFEQLGSMDDFDQSSQQDRVMEIVESGRDTDVSNELLDGMRGILKIDKIDMEMAIFDGATVEALNKGAGMIEPNKQFGVNNVGLAGHRAITHGKQFNRLEELLPGDEMSVVTKDGTFEYVITDTFVVHQSEVSVLNDKMNPLLTLVTCTPIGSRNPPNRLIVQGELKE